MTNGIAVRPGSKLFVLDYWQNGRCTSGYSHGSRSLELVFKTVLKDPKFKSGWGYEMFDKYANKQTLVVPEQLVWWEDDQEL